MNRWYVRYVDTLLGVRENAIERDLAHPWRVPMYKGYSSFAYVHGKIVNFHENMHRFPNLICESMVRVVHWYVPRLHENALQEDTCHYHFSLVEPTRHGCVKMQRQARARSGSGAKVLLYLYKYI